jgi:hypothetical protein
VISITERKPERVGGKAERTLNGTLRSNVKAEKSNFDVTLDEMSQAAFDTLYVASYLGQEVPVTGDFIGGFTITCVVEIDSAVYLRNVTSFLRAPQISLREV